MQPIVMPQIGQDVELKGGYFSKSVFLDKSNMGLGAHVREGCILEEEVSAGHTVGLKQTLLADTGVIISAPVYHLRSCSYLMIIAEKTNHMFSRKDNIFERKRPGAAISVGGSGYDGWTSLGLTSINLFLQHFTTLVDQVQVDHCANIAAALTPEQAIFTALPAMKTNGSLTFLLDFPANDRE